MIITIGLAEPNTLSGVSSRTARRDLGPAGNPTQPSSVRVGRWRGPQPFGAPDTPVHTGHTGNAAAADASGTAAGQGSESWPTPRRCEPWPAVRR